MPIELGSILEGFVTRITNFGAFIHLPEGETGLVHISEVADGYVKDIRDYLKQNEQVTVKVISVDSKGKIGLSIKQAKTEKDKPYPAKKGHLSFEDKLAIFLRESEERQEVLRRSAEAKRGGRGTKNSYRYSHV
jgi:S1 RNA binding domain protein